VICTYNRHQAIYGEPPDGNGTRCAVKSLEDFVALHERLEAEGRRPWITVSA
jgi:hypothetical protein